jgi:hypothetical protein
MCVLNVADVEGDVRGGVETEKRGAAENTSARTHRAHRGKA